MTASVEKKPETTYVYLVDDNQNILNMLRIGLAGRKGRAILERVKTFTSVLDAAKSMREEKRGAVVLTMLDVMMKVRGTLLGSTLRALYGTKVAYMSAGGRPPELSTNEVFIPKDNFGINDPNKTQDCEDLSDLFEFTDTPSANDTERALSADEESLLLSAAKEVPASEPNPEDEPKNNEAIINYIIRMLEASDAKSAPVKSAAAATATEKPATV